MRLVGNQPASLPLETNASSARAGSVAGELGDGLPGAVVVDQRLAGTGGGDQGGGDGVVEQARQARAGLVQAASSSAQAAIVPAALCRAPSWSAPAAQHQLPVNQTVANERRRNLGIQHHRVLLTTLCSQGRSRRHGLAAVAGEAAYRWVTGRVLCSIRLFQNRGVDEPVRSRLWRTSSAARWPAKRAP